MELYKVSGKKIRLTTKNGEIYTGKAYDYIPPQDNPDNVASISVGDIEFTENEIKSIEVI